VDRSKVTDGVRDEEESAERPRRELNRVCGVWDRQVLTIVDTSVAGN
jgi:hypothetical protein